MRVRACDHRHIGAQRCCVVAGRLLTHIGFPLFYSTKVRVVSLIVMTTSAISAMPFVPLLFALEFDFDGFRAVVGGGDFFEPGVLEGLFGGDAVVGVVDEDAA